MRVYFSGIGGVGIGPLMEIAHDAGYDVVGSDRAEGLMTAELVERGLRVIIGQDGSQIASEHSQRPIDWFVYTAALPDDHPELVFARDHGIRTSKRDEFLAALIADKNLRLIAIAGTHGKTTTTGMMVWALKQLGIPVSYSVGSGLGFGPSGAFDPNSEFFVYECDEFDRNFLHFKPWLSLVTSVDYDHPDTYPTEDDYVAAFGRFGQQSRQVVTWQAFSSIFDVDNTTFLKAVRPGLTLAGAHNRANASLVLAALEVMIDGESDDATTRAINSFPGAARRFEKLADNLYSDYGHHPVEIAATLQLARELSEQVVLVYQPHQNVRQHEVKDQYADEIFAKADEIYWLPTYLTREDPGLATLAPAQLTARLTNRQKLHFAKLDNQLWQNIQSARAAGKLVLCMGAGTIDGWVRQQLSDA